jgi:sulfur dioxygenase
VHEQILSLPAGCLLYPGHDYRGLTVTSVAEEARYNPRLGGEVNASDFAGFMNNLGLPHPKLMDIAVPANLRCGRSEGDMAAPADPDWAQLTFSFGGMWEIQPHDLEERTRRHGMPARSRSSTCASRRSSATRWAASAGARLLPLSDLSQRMGEIDRSRPVVTVCRSGARSAQAVRAAAEGRATPRWPTWPAACCAGAPSRCRSRTGRAEAFRRRRPSPPACRSSPPSAGP